MLLDILILPQDIALSLALGLWFSRLMPLMTLWNCLLKLSLTLSVKTDVDSYSFTALYSHRRNILRTGVMANDKTALDQEALTFHETGRLMIGGG